jgi:hypothetical protein
LPLRREIIESRRSDGLRAENERLRAENEALRLYADPANRHLVEAERAQNQPNAEYTNVSPQPTPAVEKHETGGAYGELMAKARTLQAATGLTEAQAFEKVFVDPANRELAKRERVENTPTTYGF